MVELGYPGLAGLKEDDLRERLEPLRATAEEIDARVAKEQAGGAPYVVVVTRDLVDPLRHRPAAASGVTRPASSTATTRPATSRPTGRWRGSACPGPAYVLVDVDRGEEFCGVLPEDALPVIHGRGRTPLTIDEGVALVTHPPRLLEKNQCFMLSGSRRADRRVPALWINRGASKLGWCWDGNPHSWLGTASAGWRAA